MYHSILQNTDKAKQDDDENWNTVYWIIRTRNRCASGLLTLTETKTNNKETYLLLYINIIWNQIKYLFYFS